MKKKKIIQRLRLSHNSTQSLIIDLRKISVYIVGAGGVGLFLEHSELGQLIILVGFMLLYLLHKLSDVFDECYFLHKLDNKIKDKDKELNYDDKKEVL